MSCPFALSLLDFLVPVCVCITSCAARARMLSWPSRLVGSRAEEDRPPLMNDERGGRKEKATNLHEDRGRSFPQKKARGF